VNDITFNMLHSCVCTYVCSLFIIEEFYIVNLTEHYSGKGGCDMHVTECLKEEWAWL